jgi:integrase
MKHAVSDSDWVTSSVSNLVRYVPSGKYFARVRIGGKLIRKSLKTDKLTVARLRLTDLTKEHQSRLDSDVSVKSGKMTFRDALNVYEKRLDTAVTKKGRPLSNGAKVYRRKCIKAMLTSWPGLEKTNVSKIRKDECRQWADKLAIEYSPSVYNNTLATLQHVFHIAVEFGSCYNNPASGIKRRSPTVKKLILPSNAQFKALLVAMDGAGGWCSKECADLVRFLAYGGFRKTEAANITWADCDFGKCRINVRVTKNGESRFVPMIPEMQALLEKLKPDTAPTDRVMGVRECQKALDSAAKKTGMARITHHDLRHLFATRCIESGADIPTVSRWLGHQDGGALAMKVYGHLRDEHSAAMASKVSFS